MVDVNQADLSNDKEVENVSVYSTQAHESGDGYRGRYNSHIGYQGNHSNRSRGGFQNYKNNGKPINQDERGNLLYDFYGNPIDASKEFDAAFALHSSSLEGNREYDIGQGSNAELGRGHNKEQGYNKGPRRQSYQGYGSSQRGGRGAQYGPRDQIADHGNRYCMVCKERGHNNLLNCSKLPDYIPRSTNVIAIPKELCKHCLSTAGNFSKCAHTYPRDYKDWMCTLNQVNFILCKDCQKHQGPQDWLKVNFKPSLGRTNLLNAWKEFDSNNDLIN